MAGIEWYDTETWGLDPTQGIAQVAGQRTDENYELVGDPFNKLVKLPKDIVPDWRSVLVHGITPQYANEFGIAERDLAAYLANEVFTPYTTVIGFNNIDFDDRFIDTLFWRNLYLPFAWRFEQERSRWDLLSAVRIIRALQPYGIEWPVDDEGNPVNRLELLAEANGIDEGPAHDAQADVLATIGLAKVLRQKQPELYNYLYENRGKAKALNIMLPDGHPTAFIYSSKYIPNKFSNTTMAVVIGSHPKYEDVLLAYDLRSNPSEIISLKTDKLLERILKPKKGQDPPPRLPVLQIDVSKCPAVASQNWLSRRGLARIELPFSVWSANYNILKDNLEFRKRLMAAYQAKFDPKRRPRYRSVRKNDPEAKVYEGLVNSLDEQRLRALGGTTLSLFGDAYQQANFTDRRLRQIRINYLARYSPELLTKEEKDEWIKYAYFKMGGGMDRVMSLSRYFTGIRKELTSDDISPRDRKIIESMQEYGHEIVPEVPETGTLRILGKTAEELFSNPRFHK